MLTEYMFCDSIFEIKARENVEKYCGAETFSADTCDSSYGIQFNGAIYMESRYFTRYVIESGFEMTKDFLDSAVDFFFENNKERLADISNVILLRL